MNNFTTQPGLNGVLVAQAPVWHKESQVLACDEAARDARRARRIPAATALVPLVSLLRFAVILSALPTAAQAAWHGTACARADLQWSGTPGHSPHSLQP